MTKTSLSNDSKLFFQKITFNLTIKKNSNLFFKNILRPKPFFLSTLSFTLNLALAISLSIGLLVSFSPEANAGYKVPSDDKVITELGTAYDHSLPQNFSLLVWNVHKGDDKDKWANDFAELTDIAQIAFVQEGMLDGFMPNVFTSIRNWGWQFIASFIKDDVEQSGVVTGSTAIPKSIEFQRSPDREPIISTPKMIGINIYHLALSNQELLTLNIHGINFVSNGSFRNQIDLAVSRIAKHQGPIVFAGDFNTWNSGRFEYLENELQKYGLNHVKLSDDNRSNPLDHIFVRGLRVKSAKLLNKIKTSDHIPIVAEFQIDSNSLVVQK